MNSGTFKKGEKRPRQGKRGPGKVTLKGREALTAVIDGNAERLQGWLDEIEKREGPSAAFKAYVSLIEYAVPKMARNELAGEYGTTQIIVSWAGENPASEGRIKTNSRSRNDHH